MKSRLAIVPCLCLLAACGSDNAPPSPPVDQTSAAVAQPPTLLPEPVMAQADLTGEWRVAGIDGAQIDGDMGIPVSIDDATLSYEPRCLGFAWLLAFDGEGRISLERDPRYGAQRSADGTVVTCLPAVTPAFGQLGQVFDAATQANRLGNGALELSGGGRSVILFRQ